MGMIGRLLSNGGAVAAMGGVATGIAEVFHANETREMELSAGAQSSALDQHAAEFEDSGHTLFDRFVNGLNRLPRPMLAFGTLALFAYAMVDPPHFADRMVGLNEVPEPLWWLLGAVVSFYFGAREAHYFRTRSVTARSVSPGPAAGGAGPNPALDDWRAETRE